MLKSTAILLLTGIMLELLAASFQVAPYNNKEWLHIDTFKMKYNSPVGSGKRVIETVFYAGFGNNKVKAEHKVYRELVMGMNRDEPIALVRLDSNRLYYVNTIDVNEKARMWESVLLYFDKQRGDKWYVHISNSWLADKMISFTGTDTLYGEQVYVYAVAPRSAQGFKRLERIYYSKTKGFMEFYIWSHWFPVIARKMSAADFVSGR